MQIVIDIPQSWFDDRVREEFCEVDELCAVIQHGIVLPEHHGILKDTSNLDVLSWQGKSDEFAEGVMWAMEQLDSLSTIIPATESEE